MPMRSELAVSAARLNGGPAADPGLFAVVVFCLTGLAVTVYFAVTATPLDQIPLLIEQANLW
jgi:hypothetical protein